MKRILITILISLIWGASSPEATSRPEPSQPAQVQEVSPVTDDLNILPVLATVATVGIGVAIYSKRKFGV